MKAFLVIIFIIFSPTAVLSDWIKFISNEEGTLYIGSSDHTQVLDGYLYYRLLLQFTEPDKHGFWSMVEHKKIDCNIFKQTTYKFTVYKLPMGEGSGESWKPQEKWESVKGGYIQNLCIQSR